MPSRAARLFSVVLGTASCTVPLLVPACRAPSSDDGSVRVSVGAPKVYSDDIALRVLAEHRRHFEKLVGSIQAQELNEILSIRESTSAAGAVVASSASGDVLPPPDLGAAGDGDLPASPSGAVGLTYDELLRRQFSRDQSVSAYELLYLGDTNVLGPGRRAWLLRLDVSLDRYVASGSDPKFVWIDFRVEPESGDKAGVEADRTAGGKGGDGARIYMMMPEYSGLAAQEALASAMLRSVSAGVAYPVGSFDLQATGDLQNVLETGLLQVLEQPLQFAVYGKEEDRCSFVFGPRRTAVRRSWINPKRWFGAPYRWEYAIHPGTRPCLLVVTTPEDVKALKVTYGIRKASARSGGVATRGRAEPEVVPVADGYDTGILTRAISMDQGPPQRSEPIDAFVIEPEGIEQPEREEQEATMRAALRLAPANGGSLLVPTEEPISQMTRAYLHGMGIGSEGVRVLGRRWVQIDVPPSAALEKWRAAVADEAGIAKVPLYLHTPGAKVEELDVVLHPADKVVKPAEWTVTPAKGTGPLAVQLAPRDVKRVDQVKVISVTTEKGMEKASFFPEPGGKALVVMLPGPPASHKKATVSFVVEYHDGGQTFLASVFQYENS